MGRQVKDKQTKFYFQPSILLKIFTLYVTYTGQRSHTSTVTGKTQGSILLKIFTLYVTDTGQRSHTSTVTGKTQGSILLKIFTLYVTDTGQRSHTSTVTGKTQGSILLKMSYTLCHLFRTKVSYQHSHRKDSR